jgi:prepilin-type N-terminal cleavage/methylation domain-containing protein
MPRSAGYRAHGTRFEGYTLVELVVVITITGIMAAYIAPRFWSQQTFSDRGYVDELAAALRSTQKAAVITGCAAQLTLSTSSYVARQQAALGNACNPNDATWSTPLLSADGSAIQNTAPANTTASPIGVFQFDTQGRLSSSPATTITVGTHTITILAGTGLVQVQ